MLMHFLRNIGGFEKSVQKMNAGHREERRNVLFKMFTSWKADLVSNKKKGVKVVHHLG